jgi:hypothetical protein
MVLGVALFSLGAETWKIDVRMDLQVILRFLCFQPVKRKKMNIRMKKSGSLPPPRSLLNYLWI